MSHESSPSGSIYPLPYPQPPCRCRQITCCWSMHPLSAGPLTYFGRGQTDPEDVAKIRAAVEEKREACLCLLNYKKGGSTFHNQFFLTPLFDSEGNLVSRIAKALELPECIVSTVPCRKAPAFSPKTPKWNAETTASAAWEWSPRNKPFRPWHLIKFVIPYCGRVFPGYSPPRSLNVLRVRICVAQKWLEIFAASVESGSCGAWRPFEVSFLTSAHSPRCVYVSRIFPGVSFVGRG